MIGTREEYIHDLYELKKQKPKRPRGRRNDIWFSGYVANMSYNLKTSFRLAVFTPSNCQISYISLSLLELNINKRLSDFCLYYTSAYPPSSGVHLKAVGATCHRAKELQVPTEYPRTKVLLPAWTAPLKTTRL